MSCGVTLKLLRQLGFEDWRPEGLFVCDRDAGHPGEHAAGNLFWSQSDDLIPAELFPLGIGIVSQRRRTG